MARTTGQRTPREIHEMRVEFAEYFEAALQGYAEAWGLPQRGRLAAIFERISPYDPELQSTYLTYYRRGINTPQNYGRCILFERSLVGPNGYHFINAERMATMCDLPTFKNVIDQADIVGMADDDPIRRYIIEAFAIIDTPRWIDSASKLRMEIVQSMLQQSRSVKYLHNMDLVGGWRTIALSLAHQLQQFRSLSQGDGSSDYREAFLGSEAIAS